MLPSRQAALANALVCERTWLCRQSIQVAPYLPAAGCHAKTQLRSLAVQGQSVTLSSCSSCCRACSAFLASSRARARCSSRPSSSRCRRDTCAQTRAKTRLQDQHKQRRHVQLLFSQQPWLCDMLFRRLSLWPSVPHTRSRTVLRVLTHVSCSTESAFLSQTHHAAGLPQTSVRPGR